MIYALIIFSFLLESVFTNIVKLNSFLIPLFLLTSLTILYPYFRNNKNFIIACAVCGLFYDIAFSDSIFINTISFVFTSAVIIFGYSYANDSVYSSNIINIICIAFYRIVSYLLLCIVDFISFNKLILFSWVKKPKSSTSS